VERISTSVPEIEPWREVCNKNAAYIQNACNREGEKYDLKQIVLSHKHYEQKLGTVLQLQDLVECTSQKLSFHLPVHQSFDLFVIAPKVPDRFRLNSV
jgi:hypothetical protein